MTESADTPSALAVLDCRGETCPLPVLRTRRHLQSLAAHAELSVLCTDPMAPLDLQAFCVREGHTWLEAVAHADGHVQVRLRRRSEA